MNIGRSRVSVLLLLRLHFQWNKLWKFHSEIAHLSLPLSNGWVALSVLIVRRMSCYGNTQPNLHFFQYIQALKPHINPLPLNSKQYQVILTQYHQVPTSTTSYWPSTIISTSSAPYWPSTIIYQPVPPYTVPVPPSINKFRSILTQYHLISYSNVRLSFVDLRWAQLY